MSAPDPQQPNGLAGSSPIRSTAAGPLDSRRATRCANTTQLSRGGEDSQQSMVAAAIPTVRSTAGADSDQAMCGMTPTSTSPDRANSDEARSTPLPKDGMPRRPNVPEQQPHSGSGSSLDGDAHTRRALLLWDPILQTLADGLTDIETVRIAQANRFRILTATSADSDGETRGFGLADTHPAVAALQTQLSTLEFLEKSMTRALSKQLRGHPLHPWIKAQRGLGEKTVARLFGAIRDPYWNDLHDRPRTVGELFAFCGVAGPGQRRMRGVKSNWSPDARKRLWIMTGPIIRGDGPYRDVYDAARLKYAVKLHTEPCVMCGKKGQPAEAGTDWRDGHKHAGAIRLVMRAILRDLWTEARDVYDQTESAA